MKKIITIVLFAFVGASLGFLLVESRRAGLENAPGNPETARVEAIEAQAAPAAAAPVNVSAATSAQSRKVIAYYFHGNFRCATCRSLEEYSREAIMTGFPDAINSGELEWRAVNVEDPGNEHYNDDYKLVTKSVILSEVINGQESRWVNLDQIWQLVNDPNAFKSYVRNEVSAVLNTL